MIEFDDIYDFYYKRSEEERRELIGKCIRDRHGIYFPVELDITQFNYGKRQGLIYVSPILKTSEGSKYFKVTAFSPDDLDVDLEFEHHECHLRQEVIAFIQQAPKMNVTYKGFLFRIQERFNAGELY